MGDLNLGDIQYKTNDYGFVWICQKFTWICHGFDSVPICTLKHTIYGQNNSGYCRDGPLINQICLDLIPK